MPLLPTSADPTSLSWGSPPQTTSHSTLRSSPRLSLRSFRASQGDTLEPTSSTQESSKSSRTDLASDHNSFEAIHPDRPVSVRQFPHCDLFPERRGVCRDCLAKQLCRYSATVCVPRTRSRMPGCSL